MRRFAFLTLDVFTETRFGGNPLAVFPRCARPVGPGDAGPRGRVQPQRDHLRPAPGDPANTARVRIFNRVAEMPFAGHPNVGTGFALADRAVDGLLRFEEIAGLVEVRVDLAGATVAAPQPLGLAPRWSRPPSPPASASPGGCADGAPPPGAGRACGNSFVLVEVTADALTRAAPDLAAFRAAERAWPHARQAPQEAPRLPVYLYARTGASTLRARMFSPLSGTIEDAATGSAATPLAALLCRLGEGTAFDITRASRWAGPPCCAPPPRRQRTASAPASAAAACACWRASPVCSA
jgi:trans-2,3-dihydro-3-hydroxyanthranilate isomerase